MITLVEKTKKIKKMPFGENLKVGEVVDASITLSILDSNNLVLKEGEHVLGYFGDVRTAFKKSLDFVIKGSTEELVVESVLDAISALDAKIDSLPNLRARDLKKGN